MELLHRLRDHPVAAILVWIPTIIFLPGEWITIGGAITDNANLTRIALGMAGLLVIYWIHRSGPGQASPFPSQPGKAKGQEAAPDSSTPPPMFDIKKLREGHFEENRSLGSILRSDEAGNVTGKRNRSHRYGQKAK